MDKEALSKMDEESLFALQNTIADVIKEKNLAKGVINV